MSKGGLTRRSFLKSVLALPLLFVFRRGIDTDNLGTSDSDLLCQVDGIDDLGGVGNSYDDVVVTGEWWDQS